MNDQPELIKLNQVTYTYLSSEKPEPVLENINMAVSRGEWVAIAGTNGSGKSTLAKLMAGLFPVSSGEIKLTVPEHPPIQLVFQNPDTQVIGETVFEDLCFGMENYSAPEAEMRERAMDALEKTGLAAHAHTPVSQLSGGQKQLLAIASCLCVKPAVIIFDEATSMLDPLSRQNIIKVAQQLHREGTTIVWITQWLDELAWADRVVALNLGKIVYEGSARDFFYMTDVHKQSCCERLGFTPPYTVQVAQSLLRSGLKLNPLPLTAAELGKAVISQI